MGNVSQTMEGVIPLLDKTNDPAPIQHYSIETTFNEIREYNSVRFKILCSPGPLEHITKKQDYNSLYLEKNHPKFIELYNMIKLQHTYKVVYEEYGFFSNITGSKIIDILPLDIHNISGIVQGFLNISSEHLLLYHYVEVILDTKSKHRLLIDSNKIKNMIVGKKYNIQYVKSFSTTLYEITHSKLSNDYENF